MTEHPNTESIHETNATAKQIRNVERLRLRALVEANMENAERLHAPDFQLIKPRGNALSKGAILGSRRGLGNPVPSVGARPNGGSCTRGLCRHPIQSGTASGFPGWQQAVISVLASRLIRNA